MIYLYPVYQTDEKKVLDYYYCCAKRRTEYDFTKQQEIKAMVHDNPVNSGKTLTPGSIIDPQTYVIMCQPTFYVSNNVEEIRDDDVKIAVVDCTTAYLYYFNGRWRLGTTNSWDISTIGEYSENITYMDYFTETLDNVADSIDLDTLDREAVHTVQYTNPNLHITEDEYRLTIWNDENFDSNIKKLSAINSTKGYVVIEGNKLTTVLSAAFKPLIRTTYTRRNRYMSSTYLIGLIKFMCHCCTRANINELFISTQLNERCHKIFEDVISCVNNIIDTMYPTTYNGITIPNKLCNRTNRKSVKKALYRFENRKFLLEAICYSLKETLTPKDVLFTTKNKQNRPMPSHNKHKRKQMVSH